MSEVPGFWHQQRFIEQAVEAAQRGGKAVIVSWPRRAGKAAIIREVHRRLRENKEYDMAHDPNKVTVDRETLQTLLQIVQNGPGEPTPSARGNAVEDGLQALRGFEVSSLGEVPGQQQLFDPDNL